MSTTARYTVAGMTCGHCASAVTDELQDLDGVQTVDVDLASGGESTATVTSTQPLAESAVREAVDAAGYQLVGGGPS